MGGAHASGGSFALGELIDGHAGALLADFQHHYRLHLPDVLDWDPRLVLALIEWLPDDGAYMAARLGGHEFYGWGKARHMMADVWDVLAATAMAGSKKRPVRYDRPKRRDQRKTWRTLLDSLKREASDG